MEFSIIIATYERCESLLLLLNSIIDHFPASNVQHEVIVANNARDELACRRITQILEDLRQRHGDYLHIVREPTAGKCKAQNKAIRQARGAILAFFDDDVVVDPSWLREAAKFFQEKPHDAMQGPILVPPEMKINRQFIETQEKFRTINFVRYSPGLKTLETLTGANMAIRKEVFSRIGYFNEELGPGRSGISEDVEFAKRIRKSGGTIGYAPEAVVYHEVDWMRLTEEFFRQRHEQQGRSRLIYKKQSIMSILPNLWRAAFTFVWYSFGANVRKKYRAKGRYYHYRAMFDAKIKTMRPTR
jgi:GT2 family glycosyltransferase